MSGLGAATDDPALPGSAKVEPATLELRGRPPLPVRFKRRMIVAAAALCATAVAGTIWLSFRAHTPPQIDDSAFRAAKGPSETISRLPADYSAVPKLGPPLPGDLGRPILERQHQLGQNDGPSQSPARAEAQSQRVQEVKTARESGLLFRSSGASPPSPMLSPEGSPASDAATAGGKNAIDLTRDPNGQARKLDFTGTTDVQSDVNPHRLVRAASPYMVSAGSVIAASLITGLRSDLPGLVTAQVTENVYDSASGRILLVPQGARLIGAYDSVVVFGQRRALVVWQRIVMPDGSAIRLDNEPASDPSGYAGVADSVDFHSWALLKGVAVATLLGAGTSVSLNGGSDLVRAIRESAQQNAAAAGNQITSRNLEIQPTITIRPGFRIVLLVRRDLVLNPWRG